MQTTNEKNQEEFSVKDAKAEIDRLLKTYRVKKDDLEWADDDWEIEEVNVELDIYSRQIKVLKAQVREHEKLIKV